MLARISRQRGFVAVWSVGVATGLARFGEPLAYGIFAVRLGLSPSDVAMLFFARWMPAALFGVFAGALADRGDRRLLQLGGMGILIAVVSTLLALSLAGVIAYWHLVLGSAVSGFVSALEFPVRRTLISEVVAPRVLARAVSVDSATGNLLRALGPFFFGGIYGIAGLDGVLAFALGAYLLSTAIFVLLLPGRGRHRVAAVSPVSFLRTVADGFAHARRDRLLAIVLVQTILANLFGYSFMTMIPVIGARVMDATALQIGLLQAAEGFTAFFVALLIAWKAPPRQFMRIFTFGGLGFMFAVLAFSFAPGFVPAMAVLLLGGIPIAGFASMQTGMVLAYTRPEMRSRALGMVSLSIGAAPLGFLLIGRIADSLGPVDAVRLMVGAGLVLMLASFAIWPEMRRPLVRELPASL